MKRMMIALLMVFLSSTLVHAQEGNVAAGKVKATTCFACHGNNGNSTNPMYPVLAGKKSDFLFERMMAYKKGQVKTETAAMMNPNVANLTEADLRDLAAYFAAQTPADPAAGKSRRRR